MTYDTCNVRNTGYNIKYDRILEREKDTVLPKAEQECFGGKEWSLERWEKNRQRWVCTDLETRASLCRLPRLCSGASIGGGDKYRSLPYTKRSGASFEQDKNRQSLREFIASGFGILSLEIGKKGWYL